MTDEPRTGGTVDHPGGLYQPGTGTCPVCGAQNVPTVANGRLTTHGSRIPPWSTDSPGTYRLRTCPGWGIPCAEMDRA